MEKNFHNELSKFFEEVMGEVREGTSDFLSDMQKHNDKNKQLDETLRKLRKATAEHMDFAETMENIRKRLADISEDDSEEISEKKEPEKHMAFEEDYSTDDEAEEYDDDYDDEYEYDYDDEEEEEPERPLSFEEYMEKIQKEFDALSEEERIERHNSNLAYIRQRLAERGYYSPERSSSPHEEGLKNLGSKNTEYPTDYAPYVLETFDNKHPDRDYFVKFNCPEFTSLCPITSQPDFATIYISYVPGKKMVESKSLKLYLFSFRNHGDFHEDCVNIIMNDLIKLMNPKYIEVWGKFMPRGGISIDPYCNYGRPNTKWEKLAWERLSHHDLYPENIDNR